jgi:hypothetical protein
MILLNKIPKTGNKSKTRQMELHKTENFYTAKETIRVKKQPTHWKKICANSVWDKGLISKTDKELQIKNK